MLSVLVHVQFEFESLRAARTDESGQCLQGLHVGTKTREAEETVIIDFEDALEVLRDGHEASRKSGVGSESDTVLAFHSEHSVSVVAKNVGLKKKVL